AGDLAVGMAKDVEPIDRLRQDMLDRDEPGAAALAPVRDLEHALLREVDELLDRAPLRIVSARGDIAADLDQLPEHRPLADDPRVRADIRRTRRLLDELREIVEAAGRFELALPGERLADGDRVRRLV